MKKEDEILAQILKAVKLDTPSPDFTENLLDYLKMEEQFLSDKESILHQKLDRNLIPSISNDFTSRVIVVLEERETTSLFRPLISKKSWVVIFSIIILFSLFFLHPETSLEIFSISERTMNQITWFKKLFTIPPVLSIAVLCLSSLLLLDSFLRKEKRFH